MPRYKNCSGSSYRFYGVLFHPWSVHEVPGSISHPKFVVTSDPETMDEITEKANINNFENTESEHNVSETTAIQQLLSGEADSASNEGTKRGKRSKGE